MTRRREDDEEAGRAAIKRALRALRSRHLLEEEAHAPAILALQRGPFASQGLEWKEKADSLELELQQCYKAQSRLSEQLVAEVLECRASKVLLQEKDATVAELQSEITQTREETYKLKEDLHEKIKALDVALVENQTLRVKLEELVLKAMHTEEENKSLIERMMLEKMKDAEKLNEINAMYQDLMDRLKVSSIEQLARQQVDGVVRRSEFGHDNYVQSAVPLTCRHVIHAHDGGCGSIAFQNNSNKVISGGQDSKVKLWDSMSSVLSTTLHGCVGSVLDLTVSHDNKLVIAACSSNNLYAMEVASGRSRHTLSGHRDKVCAVDAPKIPSRCLASAAYDHTIKFWDLNSGFCINTIMSNSNCNALCYSIDGLTICSGHLDGNLRLWDSRTGKFINEVVGHSNAITSISLSHSGNTVLTSGRDNMHNLYDLKTLEVCETFKVSGNQLASNWSRSCISVDDNYVAIGSADGSVHVWSRLKKDVVATLRGHTAPVLTCSWSGLGQPLASADKSGTLCIWA